MDWPPSGPHEGGKPVEVQPLTSLNAEYVQSKDGEGKRETKGGKGSEYQLLLKRPLSSSLSSHQHTRKSQGGQITRTSHSLTRDSYLKASFGPKLPFSDSSSSDLSSESSSDSDSDSGENRKQKKLKNTLDQHKKDKKKKKEHKHKHTDLEEGKKKSDKKKETEKSEAEEEEPIQDNANSVNEIENKQTEKQIMEGKNENKNENVSKDNLDQEKEQDKHNTEDNKKSNKHKHMDKKKHKKKHKHKSKHKHKNDKHNKKKKKKKKKKDEEKNLLEKEELDWYTEWERGLRPLSPQAKILGFFGWIFIQYLLSLSLGLFLSGAAPGMNSSKLGMRAHWWKTEMTKPPFQPPDQMLGPMWLVLYALTGVAAWLVWLKGGFKYNRLALGSYLVHLVMFQFWLALFFFLHELIASLILIVLALIMLALSIVSSLRRSRLAAGLLFVTWLWTTYMAADNAAIWWLNSGDDSE